MASWVDISSTTTTPGSSTAQSNNTTAVTLVAAPGSSVQRQVKDVFVYNNDTAAAAVTIAYNDNSTLRTVVDITLQPGETLQFADGAWSVVDSNGAQLQAPSGASSGTGTDLSQPWQFRPETYGAKGDGKVVVDGAMTASSATLTCTTSAPFSSADVGKVILVNGAGTQYSGSGTGSALSTTITGFTSASQVTLGASASATVSGAIVSYGTDDTPAINDTVSAAGTYATAHNYYAEIVFKPLMYMIGGALIQGGVSKTNSQIPLPVVPIAYNPTMTLAFIGTRSNSGPMMFQDSGHTNHPMPSNEGTVLKSTLVGATYSSMYGQPAVIGGPTVEQGYTGAFSANWNNLMIVVDGLTVAVPTITSVSGIDLTSCIKAELPWFRAMADAPAYIMAGSGYNPVWSGGQSFPKGLVMPQGGNNAHCIIGSFTAYGFATGIEAYEHTTFTEINAILNGTGFYANGASGQHDISGLMYCAEANNTHLLCESNDIGINIVSMPCENVSQYASGYYIDDSGNHLYGRIGISTSQSVANVTVNGGKNLEVMLGSAGGAGLQSRGAQTAPSVPSSGTPLTNPFKRHAMVAVTGGTVTDIKVDGVSMGVTSGPVTVPSGLAITLTYSSAPSWNWVLA